MNAMTFKRAWITLIHVKTSNGAKMSGKILVGVLILSTVVGCARVSESRLNPMNWFGKSEKAEVVVNTAAVASDPRPLMSQVTGLRVEPVSGGAIIRATGLPPSQGYYDGELLPLFDGEPQDGVLSYEFRANEPIERTRVGPTASREIIVGRYISEQSLAGIRQIRVSGASNALSVRR